MIKVHLDTTYLMPLFNLDTSIQGLNQQVKEQLAKNLYVFSYSPVSFIEIKWQIIRLEKKGQNREPFEKQFSQTLTSLKYDKRYQVIHFSEARINDASYELMKLGHNDYFDTIIASSAIWEAEYFITEDMDLKKIINILFEQSKIPELPVISVLNWSDFLNLSL